MNSDTVELHGFYQSVLGLRCQRSILKLLRTLWPTDHGDLTLGIGYPLPYLPVPKEDEFSHSIVFMGARQGIVHWPSEDRNCCALIDDDLLPLPDESVDRILVVHGLEYSTNSRLFLRELWRVLKSNGRLLIITPNRRSIWSHLDHTPLGHGNPYTLTQLSNLLRENQFTPLQSARGLYSLPFRSAFIRPLSSLLEFLGPRLFPQLSGIVAYEASKKVYSTVTFREQKSLVPGIVRIRTSRS